MSLQEEGCIVRIVSLTAKAEGNKSFFRENVSHLVCGSPRAFVACARELDPFGSRQRSTNPSIAFAAWMRERWIRSIWSGLLRYKIHGRSAVLAAVPNVARAKKRAGLAFNAVRMFVRTLFLATNFHPQMTTISRSRKSLRFRRLPSVTRKVNRFFRTWKYTTDLIMLLIRCLARPLRCPCRMFHQSNRVIQRN